MAARHVGRLAGWLTGCVALCAGLAGPLGPSGTLIGLGIAMVVTVWLVLWLPRSAHAAFIAGLHPRAARRYGLLAAMAFSPHRERAAVLSRGGCLVALGRPSPVHDALDPATLAPAERAVWLNNRACALVSTDPHEALALVERAIALRPDVLAIQHTRGHALLATGRVDEAIAVLDDMRTAGELPVRLEAERCRDLACAWDAKGEVAYAADYRHRAARQMVG